MSRTAAAVSLLAALFALAALAGCRNKPGTSQPAAPLSPPGRQSRAHSVGNIRTVIVIEDIALPCKILKHDEKSLTVLLTETDTTATIEWEKLSFPECRRIQALIRAEAEGRAAPLLPEGAPRSSTTSWEKHKPAGTKPQTPEDYYMLGRWCLEDELPDEAKDSFAKAVILDAGYEERCKAEMPRLKELAKRLQARELLKRIRLTRAAGLNGRVLKDIAVMQAQYPDYDEVWLDLERLRLKEARAHEMPREVVALWHCYTDVLAAACVTDKADDAVGEPIILNGRLYRIVRKKDDAPGKPLGDLEFRSVWSLDDYRRYATDRKGGLQEEISKSVAGEAGIREARVRQLWDGRLEATVPGPGEQPIPAADPRTTSWGSGSWLRGYLTKTPPEDVRRPELPDPETWWREQSQAIKAQVLKALWAESFAKVDKVFEEPCPACGGAAKQPDAGAPPRKDAGPQPICPVCRGTGKIIGLVYR